MTTSTPIQTRMKALAHRVKDRIIAAVVPQHTRRAIFACSLAAKITGKDPAQHPELAQAICRDLDLICTYDAMLAPMSWNSKIWQDLPTIELPAQGQGPELIRAASEVVQHTPNSLIYGTPRVMLEDTINTLRALVRNYSVQKPSLA